MSTWYGTPRRFLLPSAAAAIVLAAPGVAQEPLGQELERDQHCVCMDELHDGPGWQAFVTHRRARLGVMLGEPAEVAGRNGVRLESVPDGSPAHRGGLRGGDVVVALNGQNLGDDPTSTLLEQLEGVTPGDTVTVSFFRDGTEQTARVVTEAAPGFAAFGDRGRFLFRTPRPARVAVPRAPRAPRVDVARPALRPGLLYRNLLRDGLELAPVNPDLGEYFGTDRGVLVIEIDEDSPLGLRTGDVILAIGGRDVQDPAHVRSIMASYRDDEEIRFRVVREERTLEVTGRRG